MGTLIDTFNIAVTASESLGRHQPVKKPWVITYVHDMYNKWRELKKKKETELAKQYRAQSRKV